MRVAFQGERGAFGDEAVRVYFGREAEPRPCRGFADVFRAVSTGDVDFGLVPVENSQAGSINEVYEPGDNPFTTHGASATNPAPPGPWMSPD